MPLPSPCLPCLPPCAAVILVRRDIQPGEEITLSYIGQLSLLAALLCVCQMPVESLCLACMMPPDVSDDAPASSVCLPTDEEAPLEERREQLADYGFVCACDKCAAEELAAELGAL